jgi:hypothetical protein
VRRFVNNGSPVVPRFHPNAYPSASEDELETERRRLLTKLSAPESRCPSGGRSEYVIAAKLIVWFVEIGQKSDYLVSQRILMRDSTDSNSGSLVKTVASTRWAVAAQKASA